MLVKKLFLILIPIVGLVSSQNRDWRFRSFPRFGSRVIPRPSFASRPIFTRPPSTTETTTEKHREEYPITHSPQIPSTYTPPRRVPLFNRPRPNSVWSRPIFPTSTTTKPVVTVIVLPGDHSQKLTTTPKPKVTYVYPENYKSSTSTPKPVYVPIAHESERIPPPKPETISSHKPEQFPPQTSPKPLEIPPEQQTEVSTTAEPEPNQVLNSPEAPESNSNEQSAPQLQSQAESNIKPKPEEAPVSKPHEASPSSETQTEANYTPKPQFETQPLLESQESPETQPEAELTPELSEIQPISEQEPNSHPESKVEPAYSPDVVSTPAVETAPKTTLESGENIPDEQAPELSPESPLAPENLPYPQSTPKASPEAQKTADTTETSTELARPEDQSTPLKLKYIPGIGSSRNPISSTWNRPNWPHFSKPTTIPDHPYPWMPTTAKPIPLPSRTTTTVKPRPVTSSTYKPVYETTTPGGSFDASTLMDYQCQEPNGYFAVPSQCDAFIECKTYAARQINCPDGLHFNPKAVWPEYPCAYPSQVRCAAHYTKQVPKPTTDCPRRYGYFPSPSGDCGKYIMCQEGRATKMTCPSGLAFNFKTSTCDWPANVPSCDPDVFKGFTCPAPNVDDPVDTVYKYRHGKSCKRYIACQQGSPRLLSCDNGLSYDDVAQTCINEDLVSDCS